MWCQYIIKLYKIKCCKFGKLVEFSMIKLNSDFGVL